MPRKRYTEEQIVYALRQVESGVSLTDLTRKMGVTSATFYRWKKQYGGMGISEVRRLKTLEQENDRLKLLVADLTLDKHMLQEVIKKKI